MPRWGNVTEASHTRGRTCHSCCLPPPSQGCWSWFSSSSLTFGPWEFGATFEPGGSSAPTDAGSDPGGGTVPDTAHSQTRCGSLQFAEFFGGQYFCPLIIIQLWDSGVGSCLFYFGGLFCSSFLFLRSGFLL